ncbi:uncharacterized protein LOC141898316 [Tubulanus polymorphus]|uniref:uncharacterized protein LOC141898316 n=1 Tax=Tubulanus polymorphus TaxID=672921 RepID=UPI003DA56FD9
MASRIHSSQQRISSSRNAVVPTSFPITKYALWDHTKQGNPVNIHVSYYRNIQIEVTENVFYMIRRNADKCASGNIHCSLTGSLVHDSDGDGIAIIIDRFEAMQDDSGLGSMTPPRRQICGEINIPCLVTKNDEPITSTQADFVTLMKLLQHQCSCNDKLDMSNFLIMKAICRYQLSTGSLDFDIELITMATQFVATPISPVPLVSTALTKNLMGPMNLGQMQGEPKMGYLTMDHTRKLLPILQSDPKVQTLPLVGLWVTGIKYVYDPYVWCSCLRYLHNYSIQERVCAPPDPFVVVVFSSLHSKPEFYECLPVATSDENIAGNLKFELNAAHEKINIDKDFSPVVLELNKVERGPSQKMLMTAADQLKSLSMKEYEVNPTPEKTMFDEIMPRLTPSPHQTKASLFQSQVPEVSLLFDDNSPSANHDQGENTHNSCFPEQSEVKKLKETSSSKSGSEMKKSNANSSKNAGKKSAAKSSATRMPLKPVNRDLTANRNQQTKIRSNSFSTPSADEQENIDANLNYFNAKSSSLDRVNGDAFSAQYRGAEDIHAMYHGMHRPTGGANGAYHGHQLMFPAPPPPANQPYHPNPGRQSFPPWNNKMPPPHLGHHPQYPPRYPPYNAQAPQHQQQQQQRCYGPCQPTCRHPHFQYRPPGMGYSNSPPQQHSGPVYSNMLHEHQLNNVPKPQQPEYHCQNAGESKSAAVNELKQKDGEIQLEDDYKSLSSDDMYKKLMAQDVQLKQLQDQLQKLLAAQNSNSNEKVASAVAGNCGNESSRDSSDISLSKATSTSTPVAKKCTIATNTSLLISSPNRIQASATYTKSQSMTRKGVVKSSKQLSMNEYDNDVNEPETNVKVGMAAAAAAAAVADNSSVNESMSFSIQMTALQDRSSIESVVSEMIVDIPSYESSNCTNASDSPVIESVSMYDDRSVASIPDQIIPQCDGNQNPQYYQNLLGRINQLLEGNQMNITATKSPIKSPVKIKCDSVVHQENEVALATFEQLRKMGIELPSENGLSMNQTYVNVETAVLHKINYVSMLFDEHSETDISMQMNSLAMKYLSKEQQQQQQQQQPRSIMSSAAPSCNTAALQRVRNPSTTSPNVTLYGMSANDLSFASRKYMEKYGLMDKKTEGIVEESVAESITVLDKSYPESVPLMRLPAALNNSDTTIQTTADDQNANDGDTLVDNVKTPNGRKTHNSTITSTSTVKTLSSQQTSSTVMSARPLEKFPLLSAIKPSRRRVDSLNETDGGSSSMRDKCDSVCSNSNANFRVNNSDGCMTDIIGRPAINEALQVVSTPKDRPNNNNTSLYESAADTNRSVCSVSRYSTSSTAAPPEISRDSLEPASAVIRVFDKTSKELAKNPLPIIKTADVVKQIHPPLQEEPPKPILDINRLKQLPKLL